MQAEIQNVFMKSGCSKTDLVHSFAEYSPKLLL